ncbi:ABC transporter substrate-binding protein/permease [Erysipelothrix sp. HDW6C]|uniref:ABC transporter substrate-binding protein/permease n=1 Tax=Erysipelothrix sp. HDW6C TaxID=2714930 RepID=UPI001409B538|nr:ABC transporter substrate-binding protein/permease [Erysipelothrix sp. HDW6C]QIK69037.1 ABC transporter substrate-binding protein/permease [Erysipelothrix sp. HDW6C]
MKKLWMLLSVLLLIVTGCATTTDGSNTFTVGMECGYAPYNWTQPNKTDSAVAIDGGQYCDGYDVQIAKRVAESMGKELVIKKITWEGLILSLQSGQIDAVIAGMSPTDERKQEIAFSNVYFMDDTTAFGVVVKRDGPFKDVKTIHDMSNALVSAQIGTFHVKLLSQLTDVRKVENLKDFPTMTVALQSGELDGFVADNGTGQMINASNPDLLYIQLDGEQGFTVTEEMAGVAIGINKNNTELLDEVNAALATIPREVQQELMDTAINSGTFSTGNFFDQVMTILANNYQSFIRGTLTTLGISLVATLLGFLIALFVAITRGTKVTNVIANIYITIFRGTPMMVQAMILYYGVSMLIPGFRWSNLPFGNILAGIIIVSINTGSYMSETMRSGIQAIDPGQFEAAKSLGFTRWQTMKNIILPQAIKNAIPALGNELIVNVKDTSVLNIIAVTELFFVSNGIASTTYQIFQTFTITSAIYLTLTTILTFILRFVELRLDKTKKVASSYPTSVTDFKSNNI